MPNQRMEQPAAVALVLALVLIASTGAQGQESTAPASERNVEQQLLALEREWVQADINHDVSWYQKHVAEDFTSVDTRGRMETKKEGIAAAKAGLPIYEQHAVDDMTVRVYGDTAVVTGRITTRQGKSSDAMESYQLRFTDVFVKKNGRWQVVATQGTRIAAKP
jgi:ketosteroid isomerase-like protein